MTRQILFSTRPEYDYSDRFVTEFEGLVLSEEKTDYDVYKYHIQPTYSNLLNVDKITDMVIAEGILDNGHVWREITFRYYGDEFTQSIVAMIVGLTTINRL